MTNQIFHRFGAALSARLRSPGRSDGARALLVMLGLLVCASPALAAEIVEVRVGKHPTFTRVVFELDRPAGYRIERSDPAIEVAELIVSLEASSVSRSLKKDKALIEQVDVEPRGRRSVARVRLAQDGLRLKEMILTNPPRIVLDLIDEAPEPSVAEARPAPKPSPAPSVSDPEPAFEAVLAQIDPSVETTVASAKETAPTEASAPPAPEPEIAAAPEEPKPDSPNSLGSESGPDVIASASAPVEEVEADVRAAVEEAERETARLDPDPVVVDEPSLSVPSEPETIAETAPAPVPTPHAERPMVATSEPSSGGGDLMTYALAAGALLFVAGGALFVLRRRGESDATSDWDADDGLDDGFGDQTAPAADVNPFALDGGEETQAFELDEAEEASLPAAQEVGDPTAMDAPDEEKESESLVFGAEEDEMDDMEVISRDQVNESLGAPEMPPVSGTPDDVQQMFAEMTRRMEALESRCDELVDARDRLERQVAAQTEELRVQRAAIARTQRAVRNLGRGDDTTEQQEATEPALREPTPE